MSDLVSAVQADPNEARRLLRQFKGVATGVAHLGVMHGPDFVKGCVATAAALLLDAALREGDVTGVRAEVFNFVAMVGTGAVEAATLHEVRDALLRDDVGSVLWWVGAEVGSAIDAVEMAELGGLP